MYLFTTRVPPLLRARIMSSIGAVRQRSVSLPSGDRPAKVARVDDEKSAPLQSAPLSEIMAAPLEMSYTYNKEIDYTDSLVLAPMVRTGTLPTRLLSLYYGAGLVWSPEIVDKAIIGATRSVDPVSGVITYSKGQGPIFSTHPIEKPYLIFQIGSSDPDLAVEAARTVQQDVSGIDLNCGCPKPFSTHSGMGAALLSTPETLLAILRSLLSSIQLPISCKIRLLPTQNGTLELVARILKTGIRNLTVHCRTRDMRPGEAAIWDRLGDIVDLGRQRGVSVICNGDGNGWDNWQYIREKTGVTSVMLARAAERNPSVFSVSGPSCNVSVVIPQLLSLAKFTSNPWGNTKFLLSQFKPSPPPVSNMSKTERKSVQEIISRSKSLEEVSTKLNIDPTRGAEFIEQLEDRLASRRGSAWDERKVAEANGDVVEEGPSGAGEAAPSDQVADQDGFAIGAGPREDGV